VAATVVSEHPATSTNQWELLCYITVDHSCISSIRLDTTEWWANPTHYPDVPQKAESPQVYNTQYADESDQNSLSDMPTASAVTDQQRQISSRSISIQHQLRELQFNRVRSIDIHIRLL